MEVTQETKSEDKPAEVAVTTPEKKTPVKGGPKATTQPKAGTQKTPAKVAAPPPAKVAAQPTEKKSPGQKTPPQTKRTNTPGSGPANKKQKKIQ